MENNNNSNNIEAGTNKEYNKTTIKRHTMKKKPIKRTTKKPSVITNHKGKDYIPKNTILDLDISVVDVGTKKPMFALNLWLRNDLQFTMYGTTITTNYELNSVSVSSKEIDIDVTRGNVWLDDTNFSTLHTQLFDLIDNGLVKDVTKEPSYPILSPISIAYNEFVAVKEHPIDKTLGEYLNEH